MEKIVAGTKTIEFRRRFTKKAHAGDTLWIYTTVPHKHIATKARIKAIYLTSVDEIVEKFRHNSSHPDTLAQYYHGLEHGYAIELENVETFTPIPLTTLRKYNITPPQGLRFLDDSDIKRLFLPVA